MTDATDAAADGPDGGVELLWGRREPSNRGPKPALSVDRIARAAMEIADAEGLPAVSMQRVAADLEFTKMALYRHVGGKAELMAATIELAVGDPPDLTVLPGWRARMVEFTRQLAAAWQLHPWLPWATIGDRVMGPREVGWIEAAVRTLDGTELSGSERLDAVFVLFGHIRNTQSMSTAGTQPWTSDRRLSPTMQEVLSNHADRFPALTAAIGNLSGAAHDNGREFGLIRILDGLELLINTRQHP